MWEKFLRIEELEMYNKLYYKVRSHYCSLFNSGNQKIEFIY